MIVQNSPWWQESHEDGGGVSCHKFSQPSNLPQSLGRVLEICIFTLQANDSDASSPEILFCSCQEDEMCYFVKILSLTLGRYHTRHYGFYDGGYCCIMIVIIMNSFFVM